MKEEMSGWVGGWVGGWVAYTFQGGHALVADKGRPSSLWGVAGKGYVGPGRAVGDCLGGHWRGWVGGLWEERGEENRTDTTSKTHPPTHPAIRTLRRPAGRGDGQRHIMREEICMPRRSSSSSSQPIVHPPTNPVVRVGVREEGTAAKGRRAPPSQSSSTFIRRPGTSVVGGGVARPTHPLLHVLQDAFHR